MAKWLLKTEPEEYAYEDLVKEKTGIWDGVTNNWALKFIREIKSGDEALIYHTGKERKLAGLARVSGLPYPDPQKNDERLLVFDLQPVRPLSGSLTLKSFKDDPFFADFLLVKFSRLSVMPVEEKYWQRIMKLEENARLKP